MLLAVQLSPALVADPRISSPTGMEASLAAWPSLPTTLVLSVTAKTRSLRAPLMLMLLPAGSTAVTLPWKGVGLLASSAFLAVAGAFPGSGAFSVGAALAFFSAAWSAGAPQMRAAMRLAVRRSRWIIWRNW